MAISIAAYEWIVKVNDAVHNDLWNDLQEYLPCCNLAAAERVFEYHACIMSILDCIALCRQYRDDEINLDEPAIIHRLRRHYRDVNFESALAKAYADLAEREAFAEANR